MRTSASAIRSPTARIPSRSCPAHRRADHRNDFQLEQFALVGTRGSRDLAQARSDSFYEQKKNVSLRIVDTEQPDSFQVTGRGEFQLAIIETMRREGYELQVSKPPSSPARSTARSHEPVELLVIDVPEDFIGVVSQLLAMRKGKMTKMIHRGRAEYGWNSRSRHADSSVFARGS